MTHVSAALVRHPRSSDDGLIGIEVKVGRMRADMLSLAYTFSGAIARLRVPPPQAPRLGERLWEHTCCEAFVRRPGEDGYHELNFAPSREWAAFAFRRYRERARLLGAALDPRIALRRTADTLELEVAVRLDALSPDYVGAPLALALSAVVETEDGALSYWALAHPAGAPDFHHADAFALALA